MRWMHPQRTRYCIRLQTVCSKAMLGDSSSRTFPKTSRCPRKWDRMTEPHKKGSGTAVLVLSVFRNANSYLLLWIRSSSRSITMSIEGLLCKNKFDFRNIILVIELNFKKIENVEIQPPKSPISGKTYVREFLHQLLQVIIWYISKLSATIPFVGMAVKG